MEEHTNTHPASGSFGERLRQARESQGISIRQAAIETHIVEQALVALEEGAFQRLPNDVVARGFIRNYAQYLQLPAEELIEMYRRERGASDQISVVPATTAIRTRSYVFPNFLGVFFVTLALFGLAYVALNAIGRVGSTSQTAAQPTATAAPATPTALPTALPAATAVPPLVVADNPAPTAAAAVPAAGAQATPRPSPTPLAPIVVEVSVAAGSGESWLRVQTDGATVYERIMRGGEREVFLAQRRVFIRAGNPPVVNVSVNGLQQGQLGQVSGQPVNWAWPPE